MEKHVTAVAVIHIGLSILGILLGGFLFILLTSIGVFTQDHEAQFVLWIVGTALGGFFVITSIPSIIGGIGLLKYKNWARILVLIVSAVDLINIPIGTAVGVYSIWTLVQPETAVLFDDKQN
jgi:hypothetical protein